MVSVVIPFVREYAYLEEALQSVIAQEMVDMEIILVCNDLSPAVLPFSIDGFGLPVHLIHEPRKGSAYARNAGLQSAKGDWIQFLDVDDMLMPTKIIHQLDAAEMDVVVSPHIYIFSDGHRELCRWMPDDVWAGLLNSGLGSTSSMLWKRTALHNIGGWNPEWSSHQEYELLFRGLAGGLKVLTNHHGETLVRQRETGSITTITKETRISDGIRLREMMWEYLVTQQLNTAFRFEAFRQYVFRQLRGLYRRDKMRALRIYNKYYKETPFIPSDIHVPAYNLMYKWFGFKRTEQWIAFVLSFRPKD